MAEDAWRAHLISRPGRRGLAAVVAEIAPRASILRVRRLGGGLATSTHALDLRTPGGTEVRVVLKRYRAGDDTAPKEWAGLEFATGLSIPTPEPMALDASGSWFGTPALAMRRLDGRADHAHILDDGRLAQIAEAIVGIESSSRTTLPTALRRRFRLKQPASMPSTALTEPALDVLRREVPRATRRRWVVGHGDLHPGNMLWRRGRLSGIVDWSAASLRPDGYDLAYCRADLCILAGGSAAERLLFHYERTAGRRPPDLTVWDLACALGALRWSQYWAVAYAEQGAADLTVPRVKARATAMVRRALKELG